jgi:chemotaxis protein MotA
MAKKSERSPRAALALGETSAGAGILGLLGFTAVFVIAAIFFVTESYFLSLLLVAIALLIYVSGSEFGKLMMGSALVFVSGRHLIRNAQHVQETAAELRRFLHMRKDDTGNVKSGPIEPGTKVKLPDNPLTRDLQACLRREKGKEYTEYVAHQYYVDCREVYDHFHAHYEFVAGVMPLFGLIGTVIGLIGMFDALGANTSVENLSPQLAIALEATLYGAILASVFTIVASRFDARIKSLEYDYDILVHGLDVLVENQAAIEVQA